MHPLALSLLLSLVGAALALATGSRFGFRTGWLLLPVPSLIFALLLGLAMGHPAGDRVLVAWEWVPSLGIRPSFLVDGLSLFFGLVVSGMGVLVTWYAACYLDHHYSRHGRFYAYLMLFMGSMLGVVFAGNLMWLLVCWELTSLFSFLLIGFLHEEEEARRGARMAILTTGLGGLLLLAGIVLLGLDAGTYELSQILATPWEATAGTRAQTAMVLLLLGAFAKSAQFPFQFWLPKAMAAPTPVSAYLHSATMVKLGVFLIARMYPALHLDPWWTSLLIVIGFGTYLYGAFSAFLSHQLKAILAWSTVSQLGYLTGFYGMGSAEGVQWDLLHIFNHVLYKGSLFMIVGIILHATGASDLRQISGLWKRLPGLGVITLVAVAAMAGVPGTTGFISKEYLLKCKFDYWYEGEFLNWFPLICVILGSIVKVAFSVRLFSHLFLDRNLPHPASRDPADPWHQPGWLIQVPPALLVAASLVFGLMPWWMSDWFRAWHTPGLHQVIPPEYSLKIWHGVTREFLMSGAIVLAGLALYWFAQIHRWNWAGPPGWMQFDRAFERFVDALPYTARSIGQAVLAERPLAYLPIVAVVFAAAVLWQFAPLSGDTIRGWLILHAAGFDPVHAGLCAFAAAAAAGVILARKWTTQLVLLSVIGFLVTFYFVYMRAPDLALTQILVESATLVLVLLLLARFPVAAQRGEETSRRSLARNWLALLIAGAVGTTVTLLLLGAMSLRHPDRAGGYYLSQSLPQAQGTNAVNTILVDFRGFDTLLEITVLLIATLGCLGLITRKRVFTTPPPQLRPTGGVRLHRSLIFRAMALGIFVIGNLFAIYLLLRGHNQPGGGFIAGVCSAITLYLLAFATSPDTVRHILRMDPLRMAVVGLLLAIGAGLVGMLRGLPFLTHLHLKFKEVPLVGSLSLGTPLLFDIGVYLVVVGVCAKLVLTLWHSTLRMHRPVRASARLYAAPWEEPIEEHPQSAAPPPSSAP